MRAIVSATSDSGRSCSVEDQVGTREEGNQAGVLVVDGDPSQDIAALKTGATSSSRLMIYGVCRGAKPRRLS